MTAYRALLRLNIATVAVVSSQSLYGIDSTDGVQVYTDAAHTTPATLYADSGATSTTVSQPVTPTNGKVAVYVAAPATYYWTCGADSGQVECLVGNHQPYLNVQDYGTAGNGATDDSTAIQNAINAANAAGGGTVFLPAATYAVASTLVPKNNVTLLGYGATLKWTGAASGTLLANTNAAVLTNFSIRGLTFDMNSVSGVTAIILHSAQFGVYTDIVVKNTVTAIELLADVAFVSNPPYHENFAYNEFRNIRIDGAFTGFYLSGASSNQVVTLNRFYNIEAVDLIGYGVIFNQWTDTIDFYGTEIALNANSTTGVVANFATPGVDDGIYQINFYGLSIDAYGLAGCVGLQLNASKLIHVYGYETSPDPTWGGTPIVDNGCTSYRIEYGSINTGAAFTWQVKGWHTVRLQSVAPTAAAGSNAGTSPPSPVVAAGSTDEAGSLTCGTGTTPAAGNLAVVTFNAAYNAAPKVVQITPTTAAAAALNPYVTSIGTGGFTIGAQTAPAGSQANTVYGFNWQVVG